MVYVQLNFPDYYLCHKERPYLYLSFSPSFPAAIPLWRIILPRKHLPWREKFFCLWTILPLLVIFPFASGDSTFDRRETTTHITEKMRPELLALRPPDEN